MAKSCSPVCIAIKWILGALLFLAMVASIVGVYLSHVTPSGLLFGGGNASWSLIAFASTAFAFSRQMKTCMSDPCEMCS